MEQRIEGRQRFGQAGVGSAHLERQNKQNKSDRIKLIEGGLENELRSNYGIVAF